MNGTMVRAGSMEFKRIAMLDGEVPEVLYLHPRWTIRTETRAWNWERGSAGYTPKRQWVVKRRFRRKSASNPCFASFKAAVEYCETNA